ncbi:MAG: N-acetylmuramoyl-L-alanine amidase [Anaerolineales bacterium]|nr:N-acetylmuramoyl-L-alanine amidase [Anaerolineales bacterium]
MRSAPSLGSILAQALRQFALVVMAGMALATVFILWTPGSFSVTALAGQLADALSPRNAGLPNPVTPLPPTPTPLLSAPRIGLVSGHRGNDSGAVCPDGLTEADLNYDIALRVKAGLEAAGFQVDILDEFDNRLTGYRALALVSIHNDSCQYINELATGFKVARALYSQTPERSDQLVACLIDRYHKATGLGFHANSITPDMTQYHGFDEIHATTPAAIIETGFMYLDRRILTEEPYRVAQGVIDGIICFVRGEPVGQ